MPYIIRKVRNKSCWMVKNPVSGRVFSKCTTLEKAKRQLRLLESLYRMERK